jgi:hypothetical protein
LESRFAANLKRTGFEQLLLPGRRGRGTQSAPDSEAKSFESSIPILTPVDHLTPKADG